MRRIISLSIFLALGFLGFSQNNDYINPQKIEKNENESAKNNEIFTISKINFTGLKKTKESYIQNHYKSYLGKKNNEIDLHTLETELQQEGLFETIELSYSEIDENSVSLEINVKEKISFIPLPFASYSSKGLSGGLIVMDTNAFGVKDMFMVGGMVSKYDLIGFAMFEQPPKENWIPGLSVFVSGGKSTQKIKDLEDDDDKVFEYKNIGFSTKLGLSEKIGKYSNVKTSIAYNFSNTDEDSKIILPINDSIKSGSIGLSWTTSFSDWNGYFMSSKSLRIAGEIFRNFGLDSNTNLTTYTQEYYGMLSIQQPFLSPRLRLVGTAGFNLIKPEEDKDLHLANYTNEGKVGITILPGEFRTNKIFETTAGFEFAIKKFSFGLLSFYGNYEFVWTDDFAVKYDNKTKLEFMHGPNGGLRLYLSKIAFPAVALGVSYNVTKKYVQSSASIGISM